VVLFDSDTPIDLIQRLKPDVLVKGADYTREGIVGADFVESGGGRVVRVPLVSGYSTTSIVERLRASPR
jgi:D-beta-D-heptose 7-phosphate kinase/D-beta-D-heptose 1-phosphate adenosyltransferase